jgi:hypothetical protein
MPLNHKLNNKLIKLNLAISLSLVIGWLILYRNLQPSLPLFYTLPSPEASLASKEWLAIIPGISIIINSVHWILAKQLKLRLNQPTVWRLFWQMTTMIQILLATAFVRIIWITY